MQLSLSINSKDGSIKALSQKKTEVTLLYEGSYEEGDYIVLHSDSVPVFLQVRFDDALEESFVYLTEPFIKFKIPFDEKKKAYSLKSFSGEKHWLSTRIAWEFEIDTYKNLAKNPFDQSDMVALYPHVTANTTTRGESVFEPRNVIDGLTETRSHGRWPYNSWGINQQEDAVIKIEFGRKIEIDRMLIYLRADFPHDNWWKTTLFTFSDGSMFKADFIKSGRAQEILLPKKVVEWITMSQLIKAEIESPFPALRQWEVYGKESR